MPLTVNSMTHVVVCAIGIGVLARGLKFIWKAVFSIDVDPREVTIVSTVLIGVLAGLQYAQDYQLAGLLAIIVIGGYFLLKLTTHLLHHNKPHSLK